MYDIKLTDIEKLEDKNNVRHKTNRHRKTRG